MLTLRDVAAAGANPMSRGGEAAKEAKNQGHALPRRSAAAAVLLRATTYARAIICHHVACSVRTVCHRLPVRHNAALLRDVFAFSPLCCAPLR